MRSIFFQGCEERVNKCFLDFGVETRVVNRFNYTEVNIFEKSGLCHVCMQNKSYCNLGVYLFEGEY